MENASPDQTSLSSPTHHGDMPVRCWFDPFLPRVAREWARLARWDRMIGVWLLYWPCVWGLMLAPGFAALPYGRQFYWLILFFVGSFFMRGAGCTINDMWDRKLDAQVTRTANRPLAAKRLGMTSASIFLALQLLGGLAVLWQLPGPAQIAALSYMPLIVLYPLMKRITMWPQAFLSVVFSAGALVGWLTIGPPTFITVILYLVTMAWVLGYDTVYAHMDQADDALIGIKSTVIGLGERAVDLIVVCWWIVFGGWLALAMILSFPLGAWVMLGLSIFMGVVYGLYWDPDNDEKTLVYFRAQRWFGGAWALSCWYHVLQQMPVTG